MIQNKNNVVQKFKVFLISPRRFYVFLSQDTGSINQMNRNRGQWLWNNHFTKKIKFWTKWFTNRTYKIQLWPNVTDGYLTGSSWHHPWKLKHEIHIIFRNITFICPYVQNWLSTEKPNSKVFLLLDIKWKNEIENSSLSLNSVVVTVL